MINQLIALILFLNDYQYRPTKLHESTSQREMVVVERGTSQQPTPLPVITSEYRTSRASYYDRSACGQREYEKNCKTANGDIFNEESLTVAHRSLKFGTRIEFIHNGKSVVCTVNDRGPFVDNREFDLSMGCFRQLSELSKGVINLVYKIQ